MVFRDTITWKDLFDTRIMGLLTPLPSIVRSHFNSLYQEDSKKATDYFYKLSQDTNYIRTDRIAKDEKWVTDTEAQHSAAVDAAEVQRQSLINTAMASISLIQLKLQAGRKLMQAETTRLNTVLDYIDAVTATDTSTAPDVIWPELPEA